MENSIQKLKPAHMGIVILSLLALLPFPYGYYVFLRISVCLVGGATAYIGFKSESEPVPSWVWACVAVAILFNPVIPVPLPREIWMFFNIGCAALFSYLVFKVNRQT